MTITEQINQVRKGFEDLHRAFYDFYVEELRRDDSAYSKYRLQLSTVFFETYLEQTKQTYPLFQKVICNQEEKKAVARAALYDALVTHSFTQFFNDTANALFSVTNSHEDQIQALKALVARLSGDKSNGVSKGKQTLKGQKAGIKE